MEVGIDVVIEKEEINIDIEADYLRGETIQVYPELEELIVTPRLEEQEFKPNKYGFDTVKVKAVETEELNIAPSLEDQYFKGLYETVKVDAIECDTLNVMPEKEQQVFTGIYNEVFVKGIPLQEKTVIPTLEDQIITYDDKYKGLEAVVVKGIPIKVEENTLVISVETVIEGSVLKL